MAVILITPAAMLRSYLNDLGLLLMFLK